MSRNGRFHWTARVREPGWALAGFAGLALTVAGVDSAQAQSAGRDKGPTALKSAPSPQGSGATVTAAEAAMFVGGRSALLQPRWKPGNGIGLLGQRASFGSPDYIEPQGMGRLEWREPRNVLGRVRQGYAELNRRLSERLVGERWADNLELDLDHNPSVSFELRFK